MALIEVTSTPPGGAPIEIRAAWVGLKLAIASGMPEPQTYETSSVHARFDGWVRRLAMRVGLYRPTTEKMLGYAVEMMPAVWALEQAGRVAAAMWWCENTPHLVKPMQTVVFPISCCRLLPEEIRNA